MPPFPEETKKAQIVNNLWDTIIILWDWGVMNSFKHHMLQ